MPRVCAICKKGPQAGKKVVRKGQYKKKGGTGSKIARVSMRKFLPNLQKMRILINNRVEKVLLCTKCIKKGQFQRG